MTDISTVARAQSLLDELAAARADAVRWDFDLPSDAAYAQAKSLLRRLCASSVPTDSVEVAIGGDGDIEISVAPGDELVTITISYTGGRVQMIVQNLATGAIIAPSTEATNDQITRRIERNRIK